MRQRLTIILNNNNRMNEGKIKKKILEECTDRIGKFRNGVRENVLSGMADVAGVIKWTWF